MSDDKLDPEAEIHAYSVTRRMFYYTMGGAVAFSAAIIVLWYAF